MFDSYEVVHSLHNRMSWISQRVSTRIGGTAVGQRIWREVRRRVGRMTTVAQFLPVRGAK